MNTANASSTVNGSVAFELSSGDPTYFLQRLEKRCDTVGLIFTPTLARWQHGWQRTGEIELCIDAVKEVPWQTCGEKSRSGFWR